MGKYFGSSAVVAARGVFDPIEALGCCSARLRDWGHCGYFLVWNLRLFSLKVISEQCMTSDFHRFSNIHNSFLNICMNIQRTSLHLSVPMISPDCLMLDSMDIDGLGTRDSNCHKGKTWRLQSQSFSALIDVCSAEVEVRWAGQLKVKWDVSVSCDLRASSWKAFLDLFGDDGHAIGQFMLVTWFFHILFTWVCNFPIILSLGGQDSGVASPLSGSVEGADGSLKTPKDTKFQNLSQEITMVSKYRV